MEKLELKHIVGYLPYGLKVNVHGDFQMEVTYKRLLSIKDDEDLDFITIEGVLEDSYVVPILRPLSDLTKEIEVNGVKFVPEELLSAHFEIQYYGNMLHKNVQKLYEWHFDIHGLIDQGLAIDINTLPK